MQTVLTSKLRYEIVELIDERIREKHVTREDFTELKEIVKELGRAQKKTELRMEELARVQKETQEEIKILTLTLKDTKIDLKNEIKDTKIDLKNEIKETKIDLTDKLKNTRQDLGGVTSTLGFMLENEAYRVLPKILKDRYGIEIKERFLRRSIKSFGIKQEGEVNIFSRGMQKDKEIVIIGESRSQLGKKDIDDLLDIAEKLKGIDKGERFLLAVTHYAREAVIEYAKEKGVEIIQSFEW